MPTLEQMKETDWFKERPKVIKDLVCQFPYAASVKIKQTDQNAYVYSWFEDGTVKVIITEEDNPHLRNSHSGDYFVFGYLPDDLEFLHENPNLIIEDEDEAN